MLRGWLVPLLGIAALTVLAVDTSMAQDRNRSDRVEFSARASDLDRNVRAYPEIDFFLEKDGKPQDAGHACRNASAPRKKRLVVWMMGYSPELFHFLADEGFHVLVWYGRYWRGGWGWSRRVVWRGRGGGRLVLLFLGASSLALGGSGRLLVGQSWGWSSRRE